jgi:GMP synthase-like glutamine amidotransferase
LGRNFRDAPGKALFAWCCELAVFLQIYRGMLERLHIIQSDAEVPAGVFAELLTEWRAPFRIVRPDCGETLPYVADAVIVLGGVMGVHDEARHPFLRPLKDCLARLLANDTPLFGICLGGQLLAEVGGGTVSGNCCGERGLVEITLTDAGLGDRLFAGFSQRFPMFQWHNDSFSIPPAAVHLAGSALCPGQAFRSGKAWGVQFHPEVDAAIVAAWSERIPERERLLADFAAAEAAHRQLARQLLGNFLASAGLHDA